MWRLARLDALIAISVTLVVYHLLLSLLDLHYIVPILAVMSWAVVSLNAFLLALLFVGVGAAYFAIDKRAPAALRPIDGVL